MKTSIPITLAAMTLLLLGCSSTPVAVAPVGPNPAGGLTNNGGNGQLEVFSALKGRTEGNNPTWYQHSSYFIYDGEGNRLEWVDNSPGYYATAPRLITLPAGHYVVKAQAKDYFWVQVPVVIEPGRITKVHLDDAWQTPTGTPKTELVSVPAGYPVGWRAGALNGIPR